MFGCNLLLSQVVRLPLLAACPAARRRVLSAPLVAQHAAAARGRFEWAAGGRHGARERLRTCQPIPVLEIPDLLPQELVPATVATVKPGITSWTGSCFQNMRATMHWSGNDEVSVTMSGTNPTELLCGDLYILSTRFEERWVYLEELSPNATVKFSNLNGSRKDDVTSGGISTLVMPCGLVGSVESLVKTLSLFIGEGQAVFESNMEFLEEKGVLPKGNPAFNTTQAVDASLIKSGDYFAILRLDGLDPMIGFGTGGATGHSTVAVWQGEGADRKLYVVESTDADPIGKVYWPPPYGIIRHEYSEWIKLAQAANYHVALLPVKPDLVFDEDKFWTWYGTVVGEGYGYSRMLLSFLDTADPQRSLPEPMDEQVEKWLLQMLDTVLPYNASDPQAKVTAYRMLIMGANKRLGTDCYDMSCLQDVLAPQNRTLGSVLAMPELDSYTYFGSQEMVCSEFAARVWQHGFGNQLPVFQGSEQTPKDNYQFAIYDPAHFDASNCPVGLHTTPNGNYCQLMGQWNLPLKGFNSIVPYANINNHCESQWPSYERCPGGGTSCQC